MYKERAQRLVYKAFVQDTKAEYYRATGDKQATTHIYSSGEDCQPYKHVYITDHTAHNHTRHIH